MSPFDIMVYHSSLFSGDISTVFCSEYYTNMRGEIWRVFLSIMYISTPLCSYFTVIMPTQRQLYICICIFFRLISFMQHLCSTPVNGPKSSSELKMPILCLEWPPQLTHNYNYVIAYLYTAFTTVFLFFAVSNTSAWDLSGRSIRYRGMLVNLCG